jgi:hypothetical protein
MDYGYTLESKFLFAAKSIKFETGIGEIVCEKINGDSVVLNVWEVGGGYTSVNTKGYIGSDNGWFAAAIFKKEKQNVYGEPDG